MEGTEAPLEHPIAPPGRVLRLPFDDRSAAEIARVLGCALDRAPFQLPGGTVYQLSVPGSAGVRPSMVTLWPTIRRVDVIGPGSTVVCTHVTTVDLIEDAEVLFRRSSGEYLIITTAGKVIVRA
jgi:hypothetical protein